MKRRGKIGFIVVLLIVIGILVIIAHNLIQKNDADSTVASLSIAFNKEKEVIEYGDTSVKAQQLIKSCNGNIKTYPIIDANKIGEQRLVFTVEKDGATKDITHVVTIQDTKKPIITLKENELSVLLNKKVDLQDNIRSVKDMVDGALTYTSEKNKAGTYSIEGVVDSTKAKDYNVRVIAIDKNNNQSEKRFVVHVVKDKSQSTSTNHMEAETKTTSEPFYVNKVLLVNKNHALPRNYGKLDNGAYNALLELQKGAKNAGYSIPTLSGYRSYDYQKTLYNNYVARDGKAAADRYSARPGYSEHQSGLCFDIGDIDNDYGNTKAGKWLAKNCANYGFIIRYPKGKEAITGYMYEPWHVRYVGKTIAKEIMNNGSTLEEYLGTR